MPRRLLVLALLLSLAGCLSPEQRMVLKVERLMERQDWGGALDFLDGYLSKHKQSLNGWRYRVMIRLEQQERATAAAEYAALEQALARHEPEVLREVVLGKGGRWLLSDYKALARCAPKGVADVALFADLLEPKLLGEGSMSKVAIADDEIAAIVDALPGTLPPAQTWALLEGPRKNPSPSVQRRIVASAARHLAAGLQPVAEAQEVIVAAAGSADADLREEALLAVLALPDSSERQATTAAIVDALLGAGDVARASSAFLLGPGRRGPAEWSQEALGLWAETAASPLRELAVGGRQAAEPNARRLSFLKGLKAGSAGPRLAAQAAWGLTLDETPAEAWAALSLAEQRTWGPVFARSAAVDRGLWAKLGLSGSDALLVQGTAAALALPAVGPDPEVDPVLQTALEAGDAASRAEVARAAVLRDATPLALPLAGLLGQGDDLVLDAVLRAVVDRPDEAWQPLVAAGLKAELPLARELAVDAAAASCRAADKELMEGLLTDEDPHVAVRAASALYLLIGAAK